MLSNIKPTKFILETENELKNLSLEVNSKIIKQNFPRVHKENSFNVRFSGVLDAFADIKSVAERITENIQASIRVESQIQKNKELNQELCHKAGKLTEQNKTDLKTLYVNSKIFLDEYTNLLRFVFNWRGIGDKSVTNFYNSLEKYKGQDPGILDFKKCCINRLKAVDVYITEYRDKKVVHNQQKHKQETQWFLNNMNGEIRFIGGGRPSITPQEILFIVVGYVNTSSQFCAEWLKKQAKTSKQ